MMWVRSAVSHDGMMLLTEGAVLAVMAGGALTGAQHTLAVTTAAPGAGGGQVMRHTGHHLQLRLPGRVIIQRQEPVAGVQIVARLPAEAGL